MFGTLVVCLPSQFVNGKLVLSHRGVVKKFDWGHAIRAQKKPNQLHWAAFFGDVDHQIERIWSGARVTLTYLLRRGAEGAPSRETAPEDLAPRVQEAWRALLADRVSCRKAETSPIPVAISTIKTRVFSKSQAPITRQSVTMLKGRDHLVAATALQAGLKVTFDPYMFENCADETWQLERFPTRKEQARLRVTDGLGATSKTSCPFEQARRTKATSASPGSSLLPRPTKPRGDPKKIDDSELPAAAHLHSCEYCPWGYFGNEASEIDLYTYAALHIEIPPFGKGLRVADKPLKRAPVKRVRRSNANQAKMDNLSCRGVRTLSVGAGRPSAETLAGGISIATACMTRASTRSPARWSTPRSTSATASSGAPACSPFKSCTPSCAVNHEPTTQPTLVPSPPQISPPEVPPGSREAAPGASCRPGGRGEGRTIAPGARGLARRPAGGAGRVGGRDRDGGRAGGAGGGEAGRPGDRVGAPDEARPGGARPSVHQPGGLRALPMAGMDRAARGSRGPSRGC